MKKTSVLGFPRTIYELGKKTKGFLDPWTSLKPSFLRGKIAPDIWGVFEKKGKLLFFNSSFKAKGKSVDFSGLSDKWALVFPKRTYLPPEFPHFQFWLLSSGYVPSPTFLSKKELLVLEDVIDLFTDLYSQYSKNSGIGGKIAFGYNSTPFSFIKDETGRYFSGGQSVRVFHLHALLIPKPKKLEVSSKDLSLVYPTDFSKALFNLIFLNKKIQKAFGLTSSMEVKKAKRGVKIIKPIRGKELGVIMAGIDRVMYQVQRIVARSFYRDADKFLSYLTELEKINDAEKIQKEIKRLVVVGQERSLNDIRTMLVSQLEELAMKHETEFDKQKLHSVVDKLFIDKNGDLCSAVFGESVVLRPGMGYGVLIEKTGSDLVIRVNPLDVMRVKGVVESSGYWFEKKIVKTDYPVWAVPLVTSLVESTKK
jgi:hypothetical protein